MERKRETIRYMELDRGLRRTYRVCSFAAGQLIVDAQAQAHTHAHIYSHIQLVSPDQQCWYKLQFVDLRYYNTTEEKMASISIKGNAFPLNLKAEIINAVDMQRKTKAQIYRDYNIKIFIWNASYLLERQRCQTQSRGP